MEIAHFEHLRKKELQYTPGPNILGNHGDLDSSLRPSLIDWMIEVCGFKGMYKSTLYMAISILDRSLARTQNLPKSRYQLLAVTCIMIAAKFEVASQT